MSFLARMWHDDTSPATGPVPCFQQLVLFLFLSFSVGEIFALLEDSSAASPSSELEDSIGDFNEFHSVICLNNVHQQTYYQDITWNCLHLTEWENAWQDQWAVTTFHAMKLLQAHALGVNRISWMVTSCEPTFSGSCLPGYGITGSWFPKA